MAIHDAGQGKSGFEAVIHRDGAVDRAENGAHVGSSFFFRWGDCGSRSARSHDLNQGIDDIGPCFIQIRPAPVPCRARSSGQRVMSSPRRPPMESTQDALYPDHRQPELFELVAAPWLLMKALGIPFADRLEPFAKPVNYEAFRSFSPTGQVPALIDGATTVWDLLGITLYLADRHAGVWPEEPAARAFAQSAVCEMHGGFPRCVRPAR
jgi:hypothetical protein